MGRGDNSCFIRHEETPYANNAFMITIEDSNKHVFAFISDSNLEAILNSQCWNKVKMSDAVGNFIFNDLLKATRVMENIAGHYMYHDIPNSLRLKVETLRIQSFYLPQKH